MLSLITTIPAWGSFERRLAGVAEARDLRMIFVRFVIAVTEFKTVR